MKGNRYRYNGKELEEDFGLNWYAYGARYYDPTIGRFTGVDPIAEEFAWVTPYNYAENEPVANIDLWGLQKISVNNIRNSQGKVVRRNVNVSVNLKVLNFSSKDDFQFKTSLRKAQERAPRSFSTSFSHRVLDSPQKGMTSEEVSISVKFSLSVKQISSMKEVENTDFVGIIVDKVNNRNESGNVAGWGERLGNLSVLEEDQLTRLVSPELLLHELGHNLDLGHTDDGGGLMGAYINGQLGVDDESLKSIYLTMPVTGESMQKRYSNTTSRIQKFLNANADGYDEDKAKKAGLE